MVSPSHKRHAARGVVAAGECSGRQACRYLGLARSTLAYTPEPPTPRAVLICQEIVAVSRRHPRLGLDLRELEGLTLSLGFGPGREVLADALAIEPAGDPENDIPGGIREL